MNLLKVTQEQAAESFLTIATFIHNALADKYDFLDEQVQTFLHFATTLDQERTILEKEEKSTAALAREAYTIAELIKVTFDL